MHFPFKSALLFLILWSTASQASWVNATLTNSWSELIPFYDAPYFPVDAEVGAGATETWGAQVYTYYQHTSVSYDNASSYIYTESSYHDVWAPVGTRQWQYVGFFDPDTNELQGGSWMVVSESVLDTQFFIGSSSQSLRSINNPPPDPIVPLPSTLLPFATVLLGWKKLSTSRRLL